MYSLELQPEGAVTSKQTWSIWLWKSVSRLKYQQHNCISHSQTWQVMPGFVWSMTCHMPFFAICVCSWTSNMDSCNT